MHNEMEVRFLSLSGNEALARAIAVSFAAQMNPLNKKELFIC